jgi:hypothetical protein
MAKTHRISEEDRRHTGKHRRNKIRAMFRDEDDNQDQDSITIFFEAERMARNTITF